VFLRELLAQRDAIVPRDRSPWVNRVRYWKNRFPVVLPEYRAPEQYVNNYTFIEALGEAMNEGELLIPGSSGACSEITMQAFAVKSGQRIFNSEGLGPMGFGLSAGIGACLASGRKKTITIEGDGGFHMNSQELEVIRRLRLPMKIFVLNNDGYGSIRATQKNYFHGRLVASNPSSGLTLPSVTKIAEAYGLRTTTIRNQMSLAIEIRQVLATDEPMVCELLISPEQATAPKVSSMQRADGTMASRPLEDLAPFLDRDELRENMLIPVVED
jgi:acetolactate synthase-1/2/3 large subunit